MDVKDSPNITNLCLLHPDATLVSNSWQMLSALANASVKRIVLTADIVADSSAWMADQVAGAGTLWPAWLLTAFTSAEGRGRLFMALPLPVSAPPELLLSPSRCAADSGPLWGAQAGNNPDDDVHDPVMLDHDVVIRACHANSTTGGRYLMDFNGIQVGATKLCP